MYDWIEPQQYALALNHGVGILPLSEEETGVHDCWVVCSLHKTNSRLDTIAAFLSSSSSIMSDATLYPVYGSMKPWFREGMTQYTFHLVPPLMR